MLTTTEAAERLGTARLNVQKWCQYHKIKKFGRGYAITPKVLDAMRQSLSSLPTDKPRRGRPRKDGEMLNDAAKKLVAREARVAARDVRSMVALGANTDELAVKAWQQAVVNNADFAQWPSAKSYFDTVFYNEVERD